MKDKRDQLLADLIDLHKQATTERSHYYVASVVKRCIDMIAADKVRLELLRAAAVNLHDKYNKAKAAAA